MNMQALQHPRAPEDNGWPSPYKWEQRTGHGVWMAQGGWTGEFPSRGIGIHCGRWTPRLKRS